MHQWIVTPLNRSYINKDTLEQHLLFWDVYLQKLIDVSGQDCNNSIANTLELATHLALTIYKNSKSYPMPAQFTNAWKHGQH